MPVSHSHQLLWVPARLPMTGLPPATVRTPTGLLGFVTSQISCAELEKDRSRYTLLSWIGNVLPSHMRLSYCAPPAVGSAGGVTGVPTGIWNRYTGLAGSVTSMIDVPFGSFLPVRGLNDGSCCPVTGFVPSAWWPAKRTYLPLA